MRNFTHYIIGLAALTSGFTVFHYEKQLNLVARLENGTVIHDVSRVQGEHALSAAKATLPKDKYARLLAAFNRRVEHNMEAIRQHVKCVRTPEDCAPRKPLAERDAEFFN